MSIQPPESPSPTHPRISARIGGIAESATLAVDAKAKALKAAGRPVIGFGAGEPDFPTPDYIVQAAIAACSVPANHRYTPAAGLPALREAVAVKTGRDSGLAVGAAAALKGAAGMGAYVASKSALVRVVESMAAELRERGVNVNCVLPTIIDTPENRAAMPEADPARWVAPRALAEVVAFLASDAARAVHGAALPVSGLS